MVKRLKRWESPRKQGINIKGRGGAVRLRQLKKQQKILRKKLNSQEKGKQGSLFLLIFYRSCHYCCRHSHVSQR